MGRKYRWVRAVGHAVCVAVAMATAAWAIWVSEQVVYTATLGGASARIDTVVVSNPARQDKPDQFGIELSGTGKAAVADSQFFATVRAIRGGALHHIGEDSVVLRPAANADARVGELRVIRWVGDSLQVTTYNPKADTVAGARLSVTSQRTR